MIKWSPEEIEELVDGKFEQLKAGKEIFRAIHFSLGGLKYCLMVFPETESVILQFDPSHTNQPTPAFECSTRCDLITVGPGAYESRAIRFYYANGAEELTLQDHVRLVIDRLPDERYYVWPVLGAMDPMFEDPDEKN